MLHVDFQSFGMHRRQNVKIVNRRKNHTAPLLSLLPTSFGFLPQPPPRCSFSLPAPFPSFSEHLVGFLWWETVLQKVIGLWD